MTESAPQAVASPASANGKSQSLLRLSGVNAGYGQLRILKDISFEVNQGQIVTLIGSNGAGKTTILNTLCSVVRTWSGTVEFDGQDITELAPHEIAALGIAHVPEGRKLFTDMTVLENLEMGAFLRRDRDGIRQDIEPRFLSCASGARLPPAPCLAASSRCAPLRAA
jgi:branched-chain amino acid transport system ATP-binding protein